MISCRLLVLFYAWVGVISGCCVGWFGGLFDVFGCYCDNLFVFGWLGVGEFDVFAWVWVFVNGFVLIVWVWVVGFGCLGLDVWV